VALAQRTSHRRTINRKHNPQTTTDVNAWPQITLTMDKFSGTVTVNARSGVVQIRGLHETENPGRYPRLPKVAATPSKRDQRAIPGPRW